MASRDKGDRIRRIEAWFLVPHGLTSAALLRMALALFVITRVASLFGLREILWGASGHVPLAGATHFGAPERFLPILASLHGVALTAVLSGGLLLAILYGSGLAVRMTGPLLFGFVFLLSARNHFLLEGGDNAALLGLFLCLFMQTDRRFAPKWRLLHGQPSIRMLFSRLRRTRAPVVIHNFAVLALGVQLCLIYFFAGMAKASGDPWQQGVALHYALSVDTFSLAPLAPTLLSHPLILVALNYAVMVEQLGYPFLVWSRASRGWVLGLTCMLHVGAALSMGLFAFSFVMIVLQSAFMDEADWRRLVLRLRRLPLPWRRMSPVGPIAQATTVKPVTQPWEP